MDNKRQKDQSVEDYIKGYASYNHQVSLFEFGEVIIQKNYKSIEQVRLVSGGCTCHIEYVGSGMLTASVQGKGKDSPTPSMILRVLRELSLNHVKGILVIVQATSSNLLNFGLAIERADNDDLKVAFLAVSDDCKNEQTSKSEQRGLTGVILVNKIAGALCSTNKSMHDIYNYCSKVINNVISIGINIKKLMFNTRECLYCRKCALGSDDTELKKSTLKKISVIEILNDTMKKLLTELTASKRFCLNRGDIIVILVNNIGAFNQMEQYVVIKHCRFFFNNLEVKIAKFFIGNYLQFNDDLDLTITLLKVFDDEILELLDKPCQTTGWKQNFQSETILSTENIMLGKLRKKCRLSPPIKGPKLTEKAANVVQLCLQFACDALISCEKMLNKIDSEKGDGDTGTRLRLIADILNKRCCDKKLNFVYPFTFFLSLSKILENSVGGTMGCLYSILFEAAANTFGSYPNETEVEPDMWIQALENACNAVKKYGNVEVGDKTLYDPLKACAQLLRQYATRKNLIYSFEIGVAKSEEVAQTCRQTGSKYPDAGAHAVGIWLRAVCEGVKLRCFDSFY